jgi:hypothetical protein
MTPAAAWAKVNDQPPTIPSFPATDPDVVDWYELGEYDWDLSVVLGRFSDDEEENEIARSLRDELRKHLNHLDRAHLHDYLGGVMTGFEMYMWLGN